MTRSAHLLRILELAFRWHVALSMFVYGIAKTVQFDATAGNDAPVNSLSGQQLMWAFYGYSLGYAKFLGVVEMLGAGLLLFRRTTLLGCLVVTTVLVNVIVQDIVFGVLEGALRAAIIYQVLTVVILLLNWQRVMAVWQAFTTPVRSASALRWYWLALGAAAVLACTLFLEHAITH
ncbi:MAG: hypothetical protein IPJ76_03680 [Flavobacteriales bacterium]|nr:MAG: hypothetical protein IPJ76_03680 [Flavobacteriales bacterium]